MERPALSYFKPAEFDSPDAPGSGANMDADFLRKLEAARGECLFPWKVTAGYRTPEHNSKLGGAPDSWHMKGKAADIACHDGATRYAIVHAALMAGINGVEVCPGHVHLDDRPTPCLWPGVDK